MPARGISVTIRSNRIQEVIRNLGNGVERVVEQTASDIQRRASVIAPVDTSALRNSIYVSNLNGNSDYSQHAAQASALNPLAQITPEVRPGQVIWLSGNGNITHAAVVGPCVHYGVYQELGTRFMGAQPYMIPSILAAQNTFIPDM